MLNYSLVETPPAVEPVAVGEARDHVAVGHDCDDGLLSRLISAARAVVEKETRSRLLIRDVELRLHGSTLGWSARGGLVSPIGPVQTITASKGLVSGQETTLPVPQLEAPGQLTSRIYWPASLPALPAVDFVPGGWRLTLSVGYGPAAAAVPAALKQAILLLVGHWYEQREQATVGTLNEIPRGVDSLLSLYTVA